MGEWTEMFRRDPDLGIMEHAYMKLKTQSKPSKQGNFSAVGDHTDIDTFQIQTYIRHPSHGRHKSQTQIDSGKKRSYRWRWHCQ